MLHLHGIYRKNFIFLPFMGEGIATMRKYHHTHLGRSSIDAEVGLSLLQRIP
jgi:hypothetical protein